MRIIAFLVAVFSLAAAPLRAEPYPAHDDLFVNDYAGVLSDQDESELRNRLAALKTETGVEMTVLTLPSRNDYDPSPSIEAFATGLFNAWGIGDAARNDGILILVATQDREMRIELGSAYNQGYDVLAQDIITRYFLPEFRGNDFARGILDGTTETVARIARPQAQNLPPKELPTVRSFPTWLPVAGFAVFAAFLAFRRRIADASYGLRRCPSCGRIGMRRARSVLTAPTAEADGRSMVQTTCRHCDFRDDREERIARKSSSSGGGSFGGGKSSGGGATGRW